MSHAAGADIRDGFSGAVGGTPLLRLKALSAETGCEILGKAEFMNPGGSVKDRAALAIVSDAGRAANSHPGGTVVEGTAGNTGIGLAHVCNERGYRCMIVMPDNQSPEKYRLLEMLGAEVLQGSDRPLQQPEPVPEGGGSAWPASLRRRHLVQSVRQSRPIATPTSRPPARRSGSRPAGTVDAFVAASGTGGTLAGAAEYLKSRSRDVRCVLADPPGSSLYEFVRNGALQDHRQRLDHRRHRHRPHHRQFQDAPHG